MPKNRKKLITKLINEGFTHRTLSLFSDKQLSTLGKKIFSEQDNKEKQKQAYQDLINAKTSELEALKAEMPEETKPDELEVDKDGEPVTKFEYPDGEEKTLLNSGDDTEMTEDFDSKAQQKYLYAVNPAAAEKLASKMTKKDYENLPERVSEEEVLENWITSLVEENQQAEITKSKFIQTVQESQQSRNTKKIDKQKKAFKMVSESVKEMDPPMKVVVENIKGSIKGYLKSKTKVIELLIKESGEVQLDGVVVGEENIEENSPLEAPTIAPPTTKPGEKKRRGPFKVPNPSTKPKPKARDNKLPDWLMFDNLTEK
eukprot:SAG11_NODE_1_length_64905_cov_182.268355_61_plen_315_part_00